MSGAFRFRHFPQLDGFRGLAVILVLLGHAAQFSNRPFAVYGDRTAQLGVMLFFVLSGFLITGLLYRERAESGTIVLQRFYLRRVLRLGPALILFLGVCFLLSETKWIADIPRYEFAVCLFYLRNIFGRSRSLAHLWSLSLEEQFYLIWPWLMKLLRPAWLLPVAVSGTLLISAVRTLCIKLEILPYYTGVFYLRPWFRFDSILIGCCVALTLFRGSESLASRVPFAVSWLLLAGWTLWGEDWSPSLYLTLQMAGAAFVLFQLVIRNYAIFDNSFLRYFGKISYSVYLWQQLFLVIKEPSWGILRTFPAGLLAPIACAIASYHLVELPALRLKRRLH